MKKMMTRLAVAVIAVVVAATGYAFVSPPDWISRTMTKPRQRVGFYVNQRYAENQKRNHDIQGFGSHGFR